MVSSQRGERQLRILRMLLATTSKSDSAGPRLHRCNGRALTPQEGGPVTSEREHADREADTTCSQ